MIKAGKKSSTHTAADRAAHDEVMQDIEALRSQIDSDLTHAEYIRNGWLTEGRAPRESVQGLDAAMLEAFPDRAFPAGFKAVWLKLKPIWPKDTPKPHADAVLRSKARLSRG